MSCERPRCLHLINFSQLTVVAADALRIANRGRSTLVRDTLLAPPSRLTPEEAAALLRIPRRGIRTEDDWFAPGLAETTGQPPFELRA